MNRRRFLVVVGGVLVTGFSAAQVSGRIARIGVLGVNNPGPILLKALDDGLRELGYIEGKNIDIVVRHGDGKLELLRSAAADLIQSGMDVILTGTNPATIAAKEATSSIPIVMTVGTGVLRAGFAASLARPGGNVTGLTFEVGGAEWIGKRLQLLKETIPSMVRPAVLYDPRDLGSGGARETIDRAATLLQMKPLWVELSDNFESAFDDIAQARADGLFAFAGPKMWGRRIELVALAAKHRLPAFYYDTAFTEAGGLMSYSPNMASNFRSAARFIDRILKGAKPGDLPIEQPTRFELVINMKVARSLGIKIPQPVLLRADRVIDTRLRVSYPDVRVG